MDKSPNASNLFVIGLDGATFELIKPWAEEGELPNLSKIMREGVYGELESTIPTNSAPAWTSFVTGTNPGKHGIFHFNSLGYQTKEYLMNRKSRRCKAIWNILSEKGKKVGIINVPLTYPPEEVNGFMIAGMDTPSRENTFTYPEGLYQEIKEAVGDYQIEAPLADLARIRNNKDRRRFIKAVMNTLELRLTATKYLMDKYDWDFFFVVFMAADRIQHRFWKFMDKTHPHHSPIEAKKYGGVIFNIYKRLDGVVGELSDKLDKNTILLIVSDHGFGPAPVKYINLNKWLASKGLLTFKDNLHKVKWLDLSPFILHKLQLYMPLKLRHYLRVKFRPLVNKLQLASRLHNVDWSSTKAYADQHVEVYSPIWINLKGREPEGIVSPDEYEDLRNHIIAWLRKLRDPDTREKMIERVYKREELFSGPNSYKGPDILVEWKNDAYKTRLSFGSIRDSSKDFIGLISPQETSQTISGEHKRNGIFMIKGRYIKKGRQIIGARIVDLLPTILYCMDLPISQDIDGNVLVKAFKEDYINQRRIVYSRESTLWPKPDADIFSQEESERIRDRLRGLGYLD